MKLLLIFIFAVTSSFIQAKEFNIYIDADYSIFKDSSQMIQKGIEASIRLNQKDFKDISFNIIALNHKGNTRRSYNNYKKYLSDKNALFVFSGLHSPPLIANKDFINSNKALTFVPWAAGSPITRSNTDENWIFRLSIDDSKAGAYLTQKSISDGCKSIALIAEDTSWGNSNHKNIKSYLKNKNSKVELERIKYPWKISSSAAASLANELKELKAQCAIFVGNGADFKEIYQAIKNAQIRIPVISHWGITGVNNLSTAKLVSGNDNFRVLQTKFSFIDDNLNSFQKSVLKFLINEKIFAKKTDINPMSGFIHAFDLTQIILNHLKLIDLDQSKELIQKQLKDSLESKTISSQGLIKQYKKPFSKYSKKNKDAHEALGAADFKLRKYLGDGHLK